MSDDAEEALAPDDRRLLDDLGAALGLDPPPDGLVEMSDGLLAWSGVEDELAALVELPAPEPAGVRGGGTSAADELVFEVGDGSTVIELRLGGGRVTGTVLPAGPLNATLERPGGELIRGDVSELGRFLFGAVGPGLGRVRLDGGPRPPVRTDWFVI